MIEFWILSQHPILALAYDVENVKFLIVLHITHNYRIDSWGTKYDNWDEKLEFFDAKGAPYKVEENNWKLEVFPCQYGNSSGTNKMQIKFTDLSGSQIVEGKCEMDIGYFMLSYKRFRILAKKKFYHESIQAYNTDSLETQNLELRNQIISNEYELSKLKAQVLSAKKVMDNIFDSLT